MNFFLLSLLALPLAFAGVQEESLMDKDMEAVSKLAVGSPSKAMDKATKVLLTEKTYWSEKFSAKLEPQNLMKACPANKNRRFVCGRGIWLKDLQAYTHSAVALSRAVDAMMEFTRMENAEKPIWADLHQAEALLEASALLIQRSAAFPKPVDQEECLVQELEKRSVDRHLMAFYTKAERLLLSVSTKPEVIASDLTIEKDLYKTVERRMFDLKNKIPKRMDDIDVNAMIIKLSPFQK